MDIKDFNRVKIFALDSFIAANAQSDEAALYKILSPMVQDILTESLKEYQKHLKIEHYFEKIQKNRLETQIETDLAIYNRRMFKK